MVPSVPVTHRGKRRIEEAVASSTEFVAFARDPVAGKEPSDPGGMFPKKLLHGPLSPVREPADPVEPVDPAEPVEPAEPAEPVDWADESAGAPPKTNATASGNAAMTGGRELIRCT